MKTASRSDRKVEPLSKEFLLLKISREFSCKQMDRIKMGLIPLDMDEKWFMYYEEDTLYIHRSWTGYCVFVVKFNQFNDGSGEIYEVLVTRDKSWQEYANEEKERLLLHNLIYEHLLEEF